MRAIEALQHRSRFALVAMFSPLLPGLVAAAVSMFAGRTAHPIVLWCVSYWWVLLVAGALLHVVMAIVMPWLLRCPYCRYRLNRSGISIFALAFPAGAGIRHCPHCGSAWTGDAKAGGER